MTKLDFNKFAKELEIVKEFSGYELPEYKKLLAMNYTFWCRNAYEEYVRDTDIEELINEDDECLGVELIKVFNEKGWTIQGWLNAVIKKNVEMERFNQCYINSYWS